MEGFLRLVEIITRSSGKRKMRRYFRELRRSGDDRRLRAATDEVGEILESVVRTLCGLSKVNEVCGEYSSGNPKITVGKYFGKYFVKIENAAIPRETLLYANLSLRDKFMEGMEELTNLGTTVSAIDDDGEVPYISDGDRTPSDIFTEANLQCEYMKIESVCMGVLSKKTYKSQVLQPKFRSRRLPKSRKDELSLTVKFALNCYYPITRAEIERRLTPLLEGISNDYGVTATLKLR